MLPSQTAEVKQAGREENLHWCDKRMTQTKVAASLRYFSVSSPLKSGKRYAFIKKKKSTIWLWKLLVAVKCHKYLGAEIAIGFCRTNSEHGDTGLESVGRLQLLLLCVIYSSCLQVCLWIVCLQSLFEYRVQ